MRRRRCRPETTSTRSATNSRPRRRPVTRRSDASPLDRASPPVTSVTLTGSRLPRRGLHRSTAGMRRRRYRRDAWTHQAARHRLRDGRFNAVLGDFRHNSGNPPPPRTSPASAAVRHYIDDAANACGGLTTPNEQNARVPGAPRFPARRDHGFGSRRVEALSEPGDGDVRQRNCTYGGSEYPAGRNVPRRRRTASRATRRTSTTTPRPMPRSSTSTRRSTTRRLRADRPVTTCNCPTGTVFTWARSSPASTRHVPAHDGQRPAADATSIRPTSWDLADWVDGSRHRPTSPSAGDGLYYETMNPLLDRVQHGTSSQRSDRAADEARSAKLLTEQPAWSAPPPASHRLHRGQHGHGEQHRARRSRCR